LVTDGVDEKSVILRWCSKFYGGLTTMAKDGPPIHIPIMPI